MRTAILSCVLILATSVLGCQKDSAPAVASPPAESTPRELVNALHGENNETRAAAAAALRRLLETTPSAKTEDHGGDFWARRVAAVKVGMKHAEVAKLLPSYGDDWGMQASGGSLVWNWRLDHYWMVTVYYRYSDTVAGPPELESNAVTTGPPELENRAMAIWVKLPEGYTGTWVTWHVNGQKSHEIQCRDGKYHGAFIAYHDNGRKSYEQHYEDGVCSGADTGWYRDGSKSYEGQHKSGQGEGLWTHWHEDGRVSSTEQLKDGQMHGVRASWYPNGKKQYETHYANGKKNGLDRAWDEAGNLLWSREYVNDAMVDPKTAKSGVEGITGITDEGLILKWRSRKVTVAEVEAAKDSPKASKEWAAFKAEMKEGDEVWYFRSPGPTWENKMGWEGYAIFRGNKLVRAFTTQEN